VKILFATSEVFPLIKTGGLGDVSYSLPNALVELGHDLRLILPAYGNMLKKLNKDNCKEIGQLMIPGAGHIHKARVLLFTENETGVPLVLLDIPGLYGHRENPYVDNKKQDWPDNAESFTVFSRGVAMIANDEIDCGWRAEVVHSNDWQTGLVSGFIKQAGLDIKTVFTIHNLSYGGNFSHEIFTGLDLPQAWWTLDGIEFYGNFSMLKAGIVFADHITTVSPSYAEEICTAEAGYGLEGVLSHLKHKLTGILNGIDPDIWNPRTDPYLATNYDARYRRLKGKMDNKTALLHGFGLTHDNEPLIGFIGRLVEQKGVDLVVSIIPDIMESTNSKLIMLGSGQPEYERELLDMAKHYPDRMIVTIGYSEAMAHRIEAASDIFLMPSRFEPCGLNQMYSQRYGTLPVVHRTGGLADTVVDASETNINNKTATGFVFDKTDRNDFLQTLRHAIDLYENKKIWNQMTMTAMQKDSSWQSSAEKYLELYQS